MEKISKFHPLKILSSRNFYKKLFGIMFVSLAFLAGCRQREVLPEPANDAIDNATLAKIQAWYNPKVARLRGAKSTGIDIYLPQWGNGKLHTLPNGEKVALFPVHREKSVQYFDIGFVRRFAVRLDAQDNIKGVKLVEMIGNKTYLKQHKETLAKRYVLGDTLNWKQAVWSRDVPMVTNNKNGIDKPCVIIGKAYTLWASDGLCFVTIATSGNCGTSYQAFQIDCEGGGGGGGWGPPPPPPSGGWGPPPPSDGGEPPSGSGGSNTPIYTDNPPNGGGGSTPPCPTCLSEDPGDNTNLPTEPPGVTLDESMKKPENQKIKCVYDELIKIPIIKNLLSGFSTQGFSVNIKVYNLPEGELGATTTLNNSYPPDFSHVEIRLDPDLLKSDKPAIEVALTIIHEMLHARMYAKIANGGGVDNIPISVPNLYTELQKYGFSSPADYKYNEAGHEFIAKWEIDELASLVAIYDGASTPNLGHKMMVWQGLYDTFRYNQEAFPDEDSQTAQYNYAENFKASKLNEPACK